MSSLLRERGSRDAASASSALRALGALIKDPNAQALLNKAIERSAQGDPLSEEEYSSDDDEEYEFSFSMEQEELSVPSALKKSGSSSLLSTEMKVSKAATPTKPSQAQKNKLEECPLCLARMPMEQLSDHLDTCGENDDDQCYACGAHVPTGQLAAHLEACDAINFEEDSEYEMDDAETIDATSEESKNAKQMGSGSNLKGSQKRSGIPRPKSQQKLTNAPSHTPTTSSDSAGSSNHASAGGDADSTTKSSSGHTPVRRASLSGSSKDLVSGIRNFSSGFKQAAARKEDASAALEERGADAVLLEPLSKRGHFVFADRTKRYFCDVRRVRSVDAVAQGAFIMSQGLVYPDKSSVVSLESVQQKGHYLCIAEKTQLKVMRLREDSVNWKKAATWRVKDPLIGVLKERAGAPDTDAESKPRLLSLESVAKGGFYIRESFGRQLTLEKDDNSGGFRKAASFNLHTAESLLVRIAGLQEQNA